MSMLKIAKLSLKYSYPLVTPTGKTTDVIAMIFFLTLSFYYTYMVLKDIQVGTKLMRW